MYGLSGSFRLRVRIRDDAAAPTARFPCPDVEEFLLTDARLQPNYF